jgi:DNA-directed RNA polymerase specialized sigma24 family protein
VLPVQKSGEFGTPKMDSEIDEFRALLAGIRDGSDSAYEQLLATYGHHVLRVVRRKLAPVMRSLFDSSDFAQSVWAVAVQQRERIANCQSPTELINLLATIASDRVIDERRRRLMLQGRNVNRETPLETWGGAPELADSGPSPSAIAIGNEGLKRLVHDQKTQIRIMALMKLEGATHEEIAQMLGIHPKTVQRMLRRLAREVPE